MSKADELGTSASFERAHTVSPRRQATAAATEAPTTGVPDPAELPIASISQNPDNPRASLPNVEGLSESIASLGLISPITVSRISAYLAERAQRADELDPGTEYLVVDGHRRLEAARKAGLDNVKVRVDDDYVSTDESLLETAFVANFHNEQMTELEQAHALDTLVKWYGGQNKAAKRLGISQANISSKLSLLKLSPELQADLTSGRRLAEHVRNLGKLNADEQRAEADRRIEEAEQQRGRNSDASTSPSDAYHGVISAEETPVAAEDSTNSLAPRQATVSPSHEKQTRPTSETQSKTKAEPIPWHDVHAMAALIRERVSPTERHTLLTLLQDD